MGWVRIDDGLCTHIKTFTLLDLDAIGLWTLCLAFCAHELTDGFVPDEYVTARVPRDDADGAVSKLIEAGWMKRVKGGFHIPQYLDYNPSKDEELARRAEAAERMRNLRSRRRSPERSGEHVANNARTNGARSQPRTRTPSSLQVENVPDSEHVRLSELLAELVTENGSKRPTPSSVLKWSEDVRLMVERDGYTLEQIEKAIRWCQADEFWRGNVMSMGKLRKQYDKLRHAAQRDQKPAKSKFERHGKAFIHSTEERACHDCPSVLTNYQANNQSGLCDDCHDNRFGEAA